MNAPARLGGEITECKTDVFGCNDTFAFEECARLRHAYFVCHRRWVPESPAHPGMDCDRYDAHALHFGVWDEHGLVAYLRALPFTCPTGFMLEHEFASLLSVEQQQNIPREGALELSRLTFRPGITLRGYPNQPHPIEYLLRELYHEAKKRDYYRFPAVLEAGWVPVLQRRFGLPFQLLGKRQTFPDGTRTVAATATMEELETGMRNHSVAKYEWYQCSGAE